MNKAKNLISTRIQARRNAAQARLELDARAAAYAATAHTLPIVPALPAR